MHTGVSGLPTQDHYAMAPSQDSNPRPMNRKSAVLSIAPSRHLNSAPYRPKCPDTCFCEFGCRRLWSRCNESGVKAIGPRKLQTIIHFFTRALLFTSMTLDALPAPNCTEGSCRLHARRPVLPSIYSTQLGITFAPISPDRLMP